MMFGIVFHDDHTGAYHRLTGRTCEVQGVVLLHHAWSIIVYYPMAHMVWGQGGFLGEIGSVDFAGGNVVHISSGVSALVFSIILGRNNLKLPLDTRTQHTEFTTFHLSHSVHSFFGLDGSVSMPEVPSAQMVLQHMHL